MDCICIIVTTLIVTARCMSSWVDFGVNLEKLDSLVGKAFVCLYDHNLFETAVDTLIAALTKNEPYK